MSRTLACMLSGLVIVAGSALAGMHELAAVDGGYRALVFVPDGGAKSPPWPLLLYLHGAIERGDDLERAAATGPPHEIRTGRALPFVVVAPLLPAGQSWAPERLRVALDAVSAQEHVDADRVYVTGKSLGGFGTWALATAFPDRFAAIVPVAAAGNPATVCRLAHLPVWAFHNRDDPVVPVTKDETAIATLERCGGKAKLTVLPASGHDAWTETYRRAELYDWLLAQRRAEAP